MASRMNSESRSVPGTSRPPSPITLSETVFSQVDPRGRLPMPEVERRGPRMQGPDRHHEPHPVHRGHQPAAPVRGDVDPGLLADQAGRGAGDALAVEVALLHPQQPVLGERRGPRLDDRHQPDVARACHGQRGQRDVQVVAAQMRPGDVLHAVEHAGLAVRLQQQLGVVDARKHRLHRVVDGLEPLGQRRGLQPRHVQLAALDPAPTDSPPSPRRPACRRRPRGRPAPAGERGGRPPGPARSAPRPARVPTAAPRSAGPAGCPTCPRRPRTHRGAAAPSAGPPGRRRRRRACRSAAGPAWGCRTPAAATIP